MTHPPCHYADDNCWGSYNDWYDMGEKPEKPGPDNCPDFDCPIDDPYCYEILDEYDGCWYCMCEAKTDDCPIYDCPTDDICAEMGMIKTAGIDEDGCWYCACESAHEYCFEGIDEDGC